MQACATQTSPDPDLSPSKGAIAQLPNSGSLAGLRLPKSVFSVDDSQGLVDDPDLEQGSPQKPQAQPCSRSFKQRLSGVHRQVA